MRKLIVFVVLVLGFSETYNCHAADLLEKIALANQESHSSQMTFLQEANTVFFADPIQSTGELRLVRPDKLRWEYTHPSRSGFIINGSKGLQWSEQFGSQEMTIAQLSPVLQVIASQMLLWLNLDEESLQQEFVITEQQSSLKLIPKSLQMQEFLSSITLSFSKEYRIEKIEVEETTGGKTLIKMSNMSINTVIADDTFLKP